MTTCFLKNKDEAKVKLTTEYSSNVFFKSLLYLD